MAPDPADTDGMCLVAAAPSVTPWTATRERAALRAGGVDAVFATVAAPEVTGIMGENFLRALTVIWGG